MNISLIGIKPVDPNLVPFSLTKIANYKYLHNWIIPLNSNVYVYCFFLNKFLPIKGINVQIVIQKFTQTQILWVYFVNIVYSQLIKKLLATFLNSHLKPKYTHCLMLVKN